MKKENGIFKMLVNYDKLRFNKYAWQIYRKQRDSNWSRPKKLFYILMGGGEALLKHRGNLWDYIDEIEKNGYKMTIKDGTKFYLPYCRTDTIQKTIARDDYYYSADELSMLRKNYLKPGMTILDVGANIGNHTVYFARRCQASHVYSFEPQKNVYEILQQNVNLNNLDSICTTYNIALGEDSGNASIEHFNEMNYGGTSIVEDKAGDIKVSSLDSMKLPKIDFIKIDVEGFEYKVLKGAENLLNEDSPIVYVEIKEENYNMVNSLLEGLGYRLIKNSDENYLYVK